MKNFVNVTDISCGSFTCVARKNDNTAEVWGYENLAAGADTSGIDLTDLIDISCGGHACVALKSDGTAMAW